MKKTLLLPIAALALAQSASAAVIFSDDFSGLAGALSGTSPDVGSGTWAAKTGVNLSGSSSVSFATNSTNYLAWTPAANNIYTLSADMTSSAAITTASTFAGIGFFNAKAESETFVMTDFGFHEGSGLSGPTTPWVFIRTGNTTASSIGDASLRPFGGGMAAVTIDSNLAVTGTLSLKLVLNTNDTDLVTAGDQYSLEYYVNDVLQPGGSFTFSDTQSATLLSSIASVGFTGSTANNPVSFSNFQLAAVPEPSTYAALLGIGALGLVLLRRRRR